MTSFSIASPAVGRDWPQLPVPGAPPRVVHRTVCLDRAHDLDAWAWQWAADPVWELGRGGQLALERTLAPDPTSSVRWTAGARIRFRRIGIVRYARVTIGLTSFGELAELSVAPRARAPHVWGTARQDRYFELAHAAADELARRLTALTDVGADAPRCLTPTARCAA